MSDIFFISCPIRLNYNDRINMERKIGRSKYKILYFVKTILLLPTKTGKHFLISFVCEIPAKNMSRERKEISTRVYFNVQMRLLDEYVS